MIRLKVSPEKAENLLDSIQNEKFRTGKRTRWKVDTNGNVKAQSVLWLFCWAYNGDGSKKAMQEAQEIFNEIFPFSYEEFNKKVGYEYAKKNRYSSKNIDNDVKGMLEEENVIEVLSKVLYGERKKKAIQKEFKDISIKEIEKSIAISMNKLTGQKYICEIKNINYIGPCLLYTSPSPRD